MRLIVRVLVAVSGFLTVLSLSAGQTIAGGGGSANVDAAYIHTVLFATSIDVFGAIAAARVGPDGTANDTWFDWSTDLCSAPLVGTTGRSFDFADACRRHDFAYRNTRLLHRRYGVHAFWNGAARQQIDTLFLTDMKRHCGKRRMIDRPPCYAWAYTFYNVVRVAGGP